MVTSSSQDAVRWEMMSGSLKVCVHVAVEVESLVLCPSECSLQSDKTQFEPVLQPAKQTPRHHPHHHPPFHHYYDSQAVLWPCPCPYPRMGDSNPITHHHHPITHHHHPITRHHHCHYFPRRW